MKTVVLVRHGRSALEDRAANHLRNRGFTLEERLPCEGDALPALTEEHAGVIIYGGPFAVHETERHPFLKAEMRLAEQAMARDLPLLGLCQGAQQIAHLLGARVGPQEKRLCEFGYYPLWPAAAGREIIPRGLIVPQAHHHGFEVPVGADLLAASDFYPHQAFRFGQRSFALQFHPEATADQMRSWQRLIGSEFFGRPGAQSAAQQNQEMATHEPALDAWFRGFLDQLFSAAGAPAAERRESA